MDQQHTNPQNNTGKMVAKLLATTVGMFAFGFALVPLYDVICDITGLNGKTGGQYVAEGPIEADKERLVSVQFLTNNNAGMPWEFRPEVRTMKVHPGEINHINFFARNPAGDVMVAQAVPSVTPYFAARYLHKTECFCFEQQQLASGESIDMPMRFIIDKEIPDDVTRVTLSYTLFDITEQKSGQLAINQGSLAASEGEIN